MRRIRNLAFVLLAAITLVNPVLIWADGECRYSMCTCTGEGASFAWGSGTLDCETADEYCEGACEDCRDAGVESVDCDDEALTIDCTCEDIT